MKRLVSHVRSTRLRITATVLSLVFCLQAADAGDFTAANTREVRLLRSKVRASQFLSKATFGPTQEAIDELANRINRVGYKRACGEWIDRQFDQVGQTSHEQVALDLVDLNGRQWDQDGVGIHRYRYLAWWHIVLSGEDQLRQRVAWALSQIFVVGDSAGSVNNNDRRNIGDGELTKPDWVSMSLYYDMLARHASGNYRELLEDVTYSPVMGVWLSSVRNRKANIGAGRYPDENYAREIMQLFSIGLYELHEDGRPKLDEQNQLIPTYDNEGIKELARVFTGFRYRHNTSRSIFSGTNLSDPMEIYTLEHDNNYNYAEDPNNPGQIDPNEVHSKTILGVTLDPLPTPLTEEAVYGEIDQALDAIFNHPNVGPFICRRLIQRLVKSNPSRGYIRRVARVFADNGSGVRGDLKAVVKAILLDPELFRGQRVVRRRNPSGVGVIPRGTEYCRLKEPLLRVTAAIRALRPTSNYDGGYMLLDRNIGYEWAQVPYQSPTVFNYYLPDYQPPGELTNYRPSRQNPYGAAFAPEFQLLTGVTANKTVNFFKSMCRNRYVQRNVRVGSCRISFNLDEELELAKDLDNLDELLQRFDLLLCNGTLSEDAKTTIRNTLINETSGVNNTNDERLEGLLLAILLSPDCAIEE